jgi:uncharacterized membrane protein YhaH (DUF805 family)
MEQYLGVLKKYAVFNGRATRTEYWMFFLVNFLISIALTVLDKFSGMKGMYSFGVFNLIYSLAVFIPSLAVLVRRLHDTGRSGWWFFISLIPIIGAIILIVFLATDSTPEDNQYGPNPKGTQTPPSPSIPLTS